ncbi:FAD/NAD(P)-binding domain-containing protein [Aureobasidium pullulans]|uniref:FAD/NAD(P)-binding domain-containing protein n=1 Tax=Aureobasidium pullulans TaxID=5580 RepID=A0A4S9EN62_AURPU|nr:FAD/NAD(P)-binding domain-containing protein [Aureobasidium pullulans]
MNNSQWRPGKRVAIVGGGPGGVSAALGFISRGYDVRIYERRSDCKPIGGGVLLATPKINKAMSVRKSHSTMKSRSVWGSKAGTTACYDLEASQRFSERVPEGVIRPNHNFIAYKELHEEDEVEIEFEGGHTCRTDILVAADGIRSGVARQAFGDPQLFHTGIRVYLAWCDQLPDIPPACGALNHSKEHQASFFPMLHDGKAGYEWWLVEPSYNGKPLPSDIEAHVRNILGTFADPLPRFADATNFDTQVYRWEVYNRPSLKKWSAGRVVGLGDAVHPVSPYAAYGMGMAIEDGYYLARSLESVDLRDIKAVNAGFEIFEGHRVNYVNHNVEFARFLGKFFHNLPYPLAWVRDLVLDYTPILQWILSKEYIDMAELSTATLRELEV